MNQSAPNCLTVDGAYWFVSPLKHFELQSLSETFANFPGYSIYDDGGGKVTVLSRAHKQIVSIPTRLSAEKEVQYLHIKLRVT